MLALVVSAGLKVIDALFEEEATRWPGRRAATTRAHARCATAQTTGSSPWAPASCRSAVHGCAAPTAQPRCRSPPTSGPVTPSCSNARPWPGCSPSCPPGATESGLEPMGEAVEDKSRSVSKSAVSRRFVAATESALAELMGCDLSGLDLVAIMVDGANFGDHLCVVRPRDRHRRDQAPARTGRRRHRERHGREAPLGRPASSVARRHPPDALRHRRLDGAPACDQGRLRPPGHRPV